MIARKELVGLHKKKQKFEESGRTPTSRPLHTRAKSRDQEIVRGQKEVSKGCPKWPPKTYSVVTDPQVQREVICDQALNEYQFMQAFTLDTME